MFTEIQLSEAGNAFLAAGKKYVVPESVQLESPIQLLLPSPRELVTVELLQLSDTDVILDTNTNEVSFLWRGNHRKLKFSGGIDNYGSLIRLRAYGGNWIIESFLNHQDTLQLQG